MTPDECPRELEATRAVLAQRVGCGDEDGELFAHARACAVCREAMALAAALASCRDEAMRDAHVPAAGQVWWRSALRAHAEATRAARRPLVWLLGVSGASALALAVTLMQVAGPQLYESVVAVLTLPALLAPDVTPLVDNLRPVLPFAALLVGCLLVTPLVVYLALSDGRPD